MDAYSNKNGKQNNQWSLSSVVSAIGLFVFLLLPCFLALFLAQDLSSMLMRVVYLLGSVGLMAFAASVLSARKCFYVLSVLLPLGGIEIIHLIINHATTSMLFVYTIIASEPGEFLELLSTGWLIALFAFSLFAAYFFVVRRFIPKDTYFFPRHSRHVVAWVVGAYFALCSLGLIVSSHRDVLPFLSLNAEDTRTAAWIGIEKICPVNQVLATIHIIEVQMRVRTQNRRLADFSFNAHSQTSHQPDVILIIGETTRYGNFSFNGYARATSPRLQQRYENDELVSMNKVYSIADLTTVSVPYMLSPATPQNASDYLYTKSIVEAFAEAGYRTAWIADQSFGNPMLLRISNTCDFVHYQAAKDYNYSDEDLLPILSEQLHQNDKPQMIVMHTLGCHFRYDQRYTERFRKFQPDMSNIEPDSVRNLIDSLREYKALPTNEVKEIIVNSYDNAISHVDFIVDTILQIVDNSDREAVVVYISDHGENLLDDERMMFLHGTYGGSEVEFHVPMFVWATPAYRQQYAEKMEALRQNNNQLTTSMSLFHTLLDAACLQTPYFDPTMSLFSSDFQADSILYGLDANMNCTILPYK